MAYPCCLVRGRSYSSEILTSPFMLIRRILPLPPASLVESVFFLLLCITTWCGSTLVLLDRPTGNRDQRENITAVDRCILGEDLFHPVPFSRRGGELISVLLQATAEMVVQSPFGRRCLCGVCADSVFRVLCCKCSQYRIYCGGGSLDLLTEMESETAATLERWRLPGSSLGGFTV